MNYPRMEMATAINSSPPWEIATGLNVTTRKLPWETKMGWTSDYMLSANLEGGNSLLIDSILSKAEESEVSRMLEMEGEVMDNLFPVTSTQMITCGKRWSKQSPPMSPIIRKDYHNPNCSDTHYASWLTVNNKFGE